MQNFDEAKIIQNIQAGNAQDFGILYDAYVKKIYNFVYFRTHHKETSEDLTSQVFFKALEKIRQFNIERGSFSSWIYRIARNAIIDQYRMKKDDAIFEDALEVKKTDDIEKDIDNKNVMAEIEKYLDTLKPEQKEIIIMRVWDELSYQEIAEITGKSIGSLKMMFSRTISDLRRELPLALYIVLIIRSI